MIKLTKLLLEESNIYEIDILLKSDIKYNLTDICNQIRALPGVVTLRIQHSDFLDSKKTENVEYTLIKLKVFTRLKIEESVSKLKTGMRTINGIKQALFKTKTIVKI